MKPWDWFVSFLYHCSQCSSFLGPCTLSFAVAFVVLRLSSSGLSSGGLGHRRTRSMVGVLAGSRSRPWLLIFRLVFGTVFGCLVVCSLVPVPYVKGWRAVVRTSRSADPTSVGLSYLSAIARTGEQSFFGDSLLQSSLLEDSLLRSTCDGPVQASS